MSPSDLQHISRRRFHFVDFAAHYQKGFRNRIVSITEVPELIAAFKGFGCYTTFFFYSDEVLTYMSAQSATSTPTIAGYKGKVWAPFFPVDLDHPDFSVALKCARLLVSFFLDRWRIDPNAMQVYFSGSRGFHLMLDTRLFGRIAPAKSLPLLFASARFHIAQELPGELRGAVDLSIKDRVRLLRLPNTVHEKSGLYKIFLSAEELRTLSGEAIKALARTARPMPLTDETGLVPLTPVRANTGASRLFKRIRRQVRRVTRKPFRYRFHRPEDLSHITFPCAGIQKIWESHVEPGARNNCAIRLASELRLLGLAEEETLQKMLEWNAKNAIDLPADEIHRVVRSAYQHRFPYRYGCRDEVLRQFCPLADYPACQAHVSGLSGQVRGQRDTA